MISACLEVHPTAMIPVGTDRAFSAEGAQLTGWVISALEGLRTSKTAGDQVQARRRALDEVIDECGVPNWDGHGAAPASELSAGWAIRRAAL